MANLDALQSVWAAFEAAAPPSSKRSPARPVSTEIERAIASLSAEARQQLQINLEESEKRLASVWIEEIQRMARLANDATVAQLVAESLKPSRVGELTPTHEALTAAFARGTSKAIEASRAAGLPVHAMSGGQVVKVSPSDK
jgi:hypothetical protein